MRLSARKATNDGVVMVHVRRLPSNHFVNDWESKGVENNRVQLEMFGMPPAFVVFSCVAA